MVSLAQTLREARACTHCVAQLPFPPNPIVRAHPTSKLLIIGQAPGTRVHNSGVPWDDPSGDRLRDWLALSCEQFYDEKNIAIMPMGFCYPGKGKSGDLPPRPECAPIWHKRLLENLPDIGLTLLIGQYAQSYYLRDKMKKNLTETVKSWREYIADGYLPLVHPSPRNSLWLKKNGWFEEELVPQLRRRTKELLKSK
ncbi:MAG: uracil-DNA glycosylase family protein [Rickettsiales bacterium]